MSRPFEKVIIVGAGPSGLLLALLLSKHGISVEVLEASHELDKQPRAAIYGSPAIPDLRRAGVIDEIRRRGMSPTSMSWRRFEDHSWITGMDAQVLKNMNGEDMRMACLALDQLDELMLEEFLTKYNGKINWKHKVVGTGQDEKQAWVDVETPEGKKKIYGDYVVGCDGAGSAVRKSLFGDEYPGFTWERQIVATNIYYDFTKFGFKDSNFILHPEHFYMAARLTKDGMYRVTYGESPGLTWEQMQERQPWKFELMLPGHPKPGEYKMINMSPYKMHQRCAPKFRVGRILLAADAAHLCNPWGGMGITGGFVDVGGLYDCLSGIWDGKADESILDLYSEKRIEKWKTVIDPISQSNFRRVSDSDPDTLLERDPVMQACKDAENDFEKQKGMYLNFFDMKYDFTQHYKTA
ncbi:FAD/NAD(P)-binding domain-containing protein [Annulohypoxylon truncatum]|uniref:FAD/NAD(P)-binding domain-containing protein n=1 Tax=Annulohypoxylon truncatum TaxID=327061 RepID=UPI0020080197|nr:FAD/NAD(P)-binding domain-containing protein [Annulohypoxylon truncatum]KAI1205621.1 FAD/NAD(P)-binding domain-containing protein [Annulohypoxylon truncatum]